MEISAFCTESGVKFIKDGSNEIINFHKPHPNFNIRISPELHWNIAMYAIEHGKSLNAAVE